jgi:hypothetical protein
MAHYVRFPFGELAVAVSGPVDTRRIAELDRDGVITAFKRLEQVQWKLYKDFIHWLQNMNKWG